MRVPENNEVRERILRGLLGGMVCVAAVFLVVIGGELIASGKRQTLWWFHNHTASVMVTTAYACLWFAALRLLFSRRGALLALATIVGLFSVVNRIKLLKLGVPILPSDLSLAGQYFGVARILWGEAVLWVAGPLAVLVLALAMRFRGALLPWLRSRLLRMPAAAACAALAFSLAYVPDYSMQSSDDRSVLPEFLRSHAVLNQFWLPQSNLRENGQLLTFWFNVRGALVPQPNGYDRTNILQALGGLEPPAGAANQGQQATDVVVIMDEAFWDPSRLPGLRFSDPLLQNVRRGATRGSLFSPVFGGYTANTEFEFLTRLSTAYLPVGAVPYTQFLRRPLPSLVSEFRDAGYSATAIHPFRKDFYRRDSVYQALGFQRFVSQEDFHDPRMAGDFVTDASVAGEVAARIEETPREKHFIFVVTMQNHGSYASDQGRYAPGSLVRIATGAERMSPNAADALQVYSSGVRDAVGLFNTMVDYFAHRRNPAVVVMFGDHLPSLGNGYTVYRETGFVSGDQQDQWSPRDMENMHSVPVLGWTNLPHGVRLPKEPFSPIFLATVVKRAAGLGDDPMDELLDKLHADYDVLTTFYSKRADGAALHGVPGETSATRLYQAVQYDLLFGNQYSATLLRDNPHDAGAAAD
jgi:phosphoglycerol transferase MdoB-like AlkP superfamily enzyme